MKKYCKSCGVRVVNFWEEFCMLIEGRYFNEYNDGFYCTMCDEKRYRKKK